MLTWGFFCFAYNNNSVLAKGDAGNNNGVEKTDSAERKNVSDTVCPAIDEAMDIDWNTEKSALIHLQTVQICNKVRLDWPTVQATKNSIGWKL